MNDPSKGFAVISPSGPIAATAAPTERIALVYFLTVNGARPCSNEGCDCADRYFKERHPDHYVAPVKVVLDAN